MLRLWVAALLLANLCFFAWTQGWLDRVIGVAAQGEHEPERLARQVRPEALTIVPAAVPSASAASGSGAAAAADAAAGGPIALNSPSFADAAASATAAGPGSFGPLAAASASSATAATASAASATPSAPVVASAASAAASAGAATTSLACFEVGPFLDRDVAAAEASLGGVIAANRWTRLKVDRPGIWIVYMGRFPDRNALLRKEEELRRFSGLNFEELKTPASLAPGLALGRFDSREAARDALEALSERGLRTARVMSIRPPAVVNVLQVDRVDPALAATLSELKLGRGDSPRRTFVPCVKR